MASDMTYELRDRLSAALAEGVSDQAIAKAKKQMRDLCDEALDDFEWRIKDDLASNLAWQVHEWFRRAFEAMLDGNEDLFRRYLHAEKNGYTGRGKEHHIGHDGQLFEYGCTVWRRKLVDAFPEILKTERILDLEDQVRSLVEQIRKLEARNDKLIRDLNDASYRSEV